MTLYRNLTWLLLPVLLMILPACEMNDDVEYTQPQLELKFAPGVFQQASEFTRIAIIFKDSDEGIISEAARDFPIEPNQQTFNTRLFVPPDAAFIRTEVYEEEGDGERLAFEGQSAIEEDAPAISIQLDPATAHVKLEAPGEVSTGETFTVKIVVPKVKDLFAVTFEVIFESQRVEPISVSAGALFGTDAIVFSHLDLDPDKRLDENRFGVAIARRGESAGGVEATDEAVVAELEFRAKQAGESTIRVAPAEDSEVFRLQKPSGDRIDDFDRLEAYLTRAQVTVNIKSITTRDDSL